MRSNLSTDTERTLNEHGTNMEQIGNEPNDKGTQTQLIRNELKNNTTLTTNTEQMTNVLRTDAKRTER